MYTVSLTGSINAENEAEAIRIFAASTMEMLRIETREAKVVKDTKGKERFLLRIDVTMNPTPRFSPLEIFHGR